MFLGKIDHNGSPQFLLWFTHWSVENRSYFPSKVSIFYDSFLDLNPFVNRIRIDFDLILFSGKIQRSGLAPLFLIENDPQRFDQEKQLPPQQKRKRKERSNFRQAKASLNTW